MVDIHCHIVPEVDDGAWDLEAAVAMVRLAVECGVDKIIATPHFKGVPEELDSLPYILRQLDRLEKAVKREKLPLELLPGAEVLCLPQTVELAREGLLPTLGDSRYVLTEFYFDAGARFIDDTLMRLRELGYSPVVAHPERYGVVQEDPDWARRWCDRGIALQVNKGSILGAFGSRAKETAAHLLYRGDIHVIASDAHSPEHRTTNLEPAREWCREHLGRTYTQLLLEENPGRIARGEPVKRISVRR